MCLLTRCLLLQRVLTLHQTLFSGVTLDLLTGGELRLCRIKKNRIYLHSCLSA